MKKVAVFAFILLLNGCAFYEKEYVSEIKLNGESYPGGDEGVFYIDNEPLIRMSMGCQKSTTLSASVFPIVPIPKPDKAEPHDTLSDEQFYLSIGHSTRDEIDLSDIKVSIGISNSVYALRLTEKGNIYKFVADLRCKDINKGILRIKLDESKSRNYKVQFKEGVQRKVRYHLMFVT